MTSHSTDIVTRNSMLRGINLPPVIFGTSRLGNLFVEPDDATQLAIVRECVNNSNRPVVFDSAGKYRAGLALETLSKCLKELNVKPEDVIISNKLGWVRTDIKTKEPTFELGAGENLNHNAIRKISYDGIIECFEQGNELLNGFIPQMVSIHDPDEYLATAKDVTHARLLHEDILDAYEALYDLKLEGKVQAIGVGAKDWKTIQRIANDVELDWVMIANSLTIMNHPKELLDFVHELEQKGVLIIISGVFCSGFLVGTDSFNHELIEPDTSKHKALFQWRENFLRVCKDFKVKPSQACVQFALNIPGVTSIVLNTRDPKLVKENIEAVAVKIPNEFWNKMKMEGLLSKDYAYLRGN